MRREVTVKIFPKQRVRFWSQNRSSYINGIIAFFCFEGTRFGPKRVAADMEGNGEFDF